MQLQQMCADQSPLQSSTTRARASRQCARPGWFCLGLFRAARYCASPRSRQKRRTMHVNIDPRDTMSNSPLSWLQIIVIAITVGLNALDGFDVLSISVASPGIAKEWGIDRAALGIELSMELVGMALGSIFLGGVADKIGRRPTVLGCLVVMAVGMSMVTTVNGPLHPPKR